MKFDSLGDRMKFYENTNIHRAIPYLPLVVRLDGCHFHTFTRKCDKPFDADLIYLMDATTAFLMDETNAVFGYTQSDEISLCLHSDSINSQIYFDGKLQKIMSVLAAKASTYFNTLLEDLNLYIKFGSVAHFDCRCFNVPTKIEAVNHFVWREEDAVRNSIQALAQSLYSHRELHGKSCNELQEMTFQKGYNWNDLSPRMRRGVYFQKKTIERKFSSHELEKLPPKHAARTNPDLTVSRQYVVKLDLDPLTKYEDRVGLLFGA